VFTSIQGAANHIVVLLLQLEQRMLKYCITIPNQDSNEDEVVLCIEGVQKCVCKTNDCDPPKVSGDIPGVNR
jgi:hypothetical protein